MDRQALVAGVPGNRGPVSPAQQETKMRLILALAAVVAALTIFDHAMRVDQQNLCERDDSIHCPATLWWFG